MSVYATCSFNAVEPGALYEKDFLFLLQFLLWYYLVKSNKSEKVLLLDLTARCSWVTTFEFGKYCASILHH
jgi:hypothetical protein